VLPRGGRAGPLSRRSDAAASAQMNAVSEVGRVKMTAAVTDLRAAAAPRADPAPERPETIGARGRIGQVEVVAEVGERESGMGLRVAAARRLLKDGLLKEGDSDDAG
jgi:hypothetical protein